MTREQYMNQLANAIKHCPKTQQDEILADFNEHFDVALSKGHTIDEIIESLGDIDEFIKDLKVNEDTMPVIQQTENHEIHEVQIVCEDCDVEIMEGEAIRMNLKDWRSSMSSVYQVSESNKNGTYIIEVTKKKQNNFFHFGLMEITPTIELQINQAIQKIKVKSKKGDVWLDTSALQIRECEIHNNNGDGEVKGTFGDLAVECLLGDIKIHANAFSTNLNTSHGDIAFEIYNGQTLNAHSHLGDVKGETGKVENISCQSDNGDVKITVGHANQVDVLSYMGDVEVHGSGEKITMETKKGDVEFEVEADTFTAISKLGDVEGSVKANQLHCSTSMGDVDCTLIHAQTAECVSSMGDVSVHVKELENFVIDAKTNMGDVDVAASNVFYHQNQLMKGNGSTFIKLRTSMGDIEIEE